MGENMSLRTINRDIADLTMQLVGNEKCGICEKDGAEILWASGFSNGAYLACYQKIEDGW